MIEILKVIFLGIVEGITEWLPISSTGHMILVDEFIQLQASADFKEMFFVVIQLGAILAVVVLYWPKLFPFTSTEGYKFSPRDLISPEYYRKHFKVDRDIMEMWFKVVVASIPAAIVGLGLDDYLTGWFHNWQTISIMLILFGLLFILVENRVEDKAAKMNSVADISFKAAFVIGIWQMIAAVFPGTSRSGATIVGSLLIGVSRFAATEFTFFLAIPAMFGASLLKLVKFGLAFTTYEAFILILGMLVAYLVSIIVIKFLLSYIKKNDFKAFGWYRIILGLVVIIYFTFIQS